MSAESITNSKNKQKNNNNVQKDDSIVDDVQNLNNSIFKTPTSCNNSYIRSRKNGAKTAGFTPRCKATPVTTDKTFYTPKSSMKDKSPSSTPVTHMCSPSLSPKGRRHFSQHNRSIVKRFLSDSSLNASTPDCTDGATPQENGNFQNPEEETSNFIVGVRVRPLNFR